MGGLSIVGPLSQDYGIWSVRGIPTYRVYQLYDKSVPYINRTYHDCQMVFC